MKPTNGKLVVALTALTLIAATQTSLAMYDPSLQRWINRDPIEEEGFQILQKVGSDGTISENGVKLFQSAVEGLLLAPDLNTSTSGENLYTSIRNNSINHIDFFGLADCPCASAPPLPANSPVCDKYGDEKYPGTACSLKCFCKCAGDSAWAQKVRACLACEHDKGTDTRKAHKECYKAAGSAPWGMLAKCYAACGGIPIIIAEQ